jgi:peptidoglycan/xylan/chitin deacetylase (PgdA/CDA1 family)
VEPWELHARRDARQRDRQVRRRRRRVALAGLLLGAVGVVLAVVLSVGGGGSHAGTAATRAASAASGASVARSPAHAHHTQHGLIWTVSPTARGSGTPGSTPVPVLMYHVIAAAPANAPFPGLYVPASEFAAQMRALKDAGWHAVTLDQLAAYWQRGVPLGAGKPIVITFDNGYHSQYSEALPVLRKLGWVADENLQLTGLPPSQGGLSRAEVRALVRAGWELDTQGQSHADLITLDASRLHYEIAVARQVIRARYHVPVNWFCYPSGHYDATVIAAVKAAGYAGSTTVVPGWAQRDDDPYRMHRLRVLGGTSPQALLAQIASSRGDAAAPASYSGAGGGA